MEYMKIESKTRNVFFSNPSNAKIPRKIVVVEMVYVMRKNEFFVKRQPKIATINRKYNI